MYLKARDFFVSATRRLGRKNIFSLINNKELLLELRKHFIVLKKELKKLLMSYLHEFCNPLFRIRLIKISGYSKCPVCVYNVLSLEVQQNKINSRKIIQVNSRN